jgi:hypothetical protein
VNKRQDVSHLRPFGCTAYAKIPEEIGASKLTPRSIKYVLIDYFGRGTYKLWDRASGTTIKSRDVIFEEGKGHRTISDAPTPTFDIAFDDDTNLTTPHDDKIPLVPTTFYDKPQAVACTVICFLPSVL